LLMSTPQDFFNSIPLVTRYHLAGGLSATLLFALGMTSPMNWVLNYQLVWSRFQVWRLLTNHLIMGKGFSLLIRLLHLFKYGGELERGTFQENSVEYSFFLFFGIMIETICGYMMGLSVLSFATIHMIMYVWARNHPNDQVSLMGVLTLKAPFLPWAFVVLTVIMGGDPILDLLGIFAGHVYWFLTDVLPKTHNIRLLKTPNLWYTMWGERPPSQRGVTHGRTTVFGGHDWGQGRQINQE